MLLLFRIKKDTKLAEPMSPRSREPLPKHRSEAGSVNRVKVFLQLRHSSCLLGLLSLSETKQ